MNARMIQEFIAELEVASGLMTWSVVPPTKGSLFEVVMNGTTEQVHILVFDDGVAVLWDEDADADCGFDCFTIEDSNIACATQLAIKYIKSTK
jgi:hypothetical protein